MRVLWWHLLITGMLGHLLPQTPHILALPSPPTPIPQIYRLDPRNNLQIPAIHTTIRYAYAITLTIAFTIAFAFAITFTFTIVMMVIITTDHHASIFYVIGLF